MTGQAPTSWSLERRVRGVVPLVVLLQLVLVAGFLVAASIAKQRGDEVVERWDPAVLASEQALAAMVNQETGVRGFALAGESDFLQPYRDYYQAEIRAEETLRRHVAGEPELVRLLAAFGSAVDTWHAEVAEPFIERVRSGDEAVAAQATSAESRAAFDAIRRASADLSAGIGEVRAHAARSRSRAFVALWAAGLLGALVLVVVGLVVARGLRRWILLPVSGLVTQTRAVVGGGLDRPIVQQGPREIELLARDVDSMRARLAAHIAGLDRSHARLEERGKELARSNADLEQFAYVASHDLSEPLRKVTNFGQLLERQYADRLDDKARQYIWFMVDGAKRMQTLIGDLLAFSRVGRTTERFVEVDLDECLDRALVTVEDQLGESGGEVVRTPLPSLQGDPNLLTALLVNLVGNALKYRHQERPVRVEVSAVQEGDEWLISVQDNGIGIDPQYAERIFTIFQRLHLRDAYGGTGIGLALCRRIADFHHGRVELVEGTGPGARFLLTLPERQPDPDHEPVVGDPATSPPGSPDEPDPSGHR